MTYIVTERLTPRLPEPEFRGVRGRARGYRLTVKAKTGEVIRTIRSFDRPSLKLLRQKIPLGARGELEQAVYSIGHRRIFVLVARYHAIDLQEAYNVIGPLLKARGPNINSEAGYTLAAMKYQEKLLAATYSTRKGAVKSVVATINKHMAKLTPEAAESFTKVLSGNYARAIRGIESIPVLHAVMDREGYATISKVKRGLPALVGVRVGTLSLNPSKADATMVKRMTNSNAFYVKDAYGRRPADLAQKAKSIMTPMFEKGLRAGAIAKELTAQLPKNMAGKDASYWRLVAENHISRSRSWGNLTSMQQAGFGLYQVEAILDKSTTEQCRYLHGKTFSVQTSIDVSWAGEENPGELEKVNPFINVKQEGNLTSLTVPQQTKKGLMQRTIATSTNTGRGTENSTGKWSGKVPDSDLAAMGIGPPPYHHA